MKVQIINTLEGFREIRRNWELVYQADPQAVFFISWVWLISRLQQHDQNLESWSILAAKLTDNDLGYVGFFPLLIDLNEKIPGKLYTEFSILGVADANHIPFICFPEYEKPIASAFADHLRYHEVWSVLKISNSLETDTRLRLFLSFFPQETYSLQESHCISDIDGIDNNIVPYIILPANWDSYLHDIVSSNARQKIRRLLKKIDQNDDFQVTQATAETSEQYIKILLDFWKISWQERKGSEHCRNILKYADLNLRHCFANNCLYLPVLWQNNQPLGAIANLVDRQKKTILFFMGGRDETVRNLSIGIILHALSIKFAIQNGFKIYEFLMGNEAYKFSLGAQVRRIKIIALQHRDRSEVFYKLDPRTLFQAQQVASIYQQANRLAEAEHIYRQILQVQSDHVDALYGLGVIAQRLGQYQTAENIFKQLLELQHDNIKAWCSLGRLYHTREQLLDAEQAFRYALTFPTEATVTATVYHHLGDLLQQRGDWNGAVECYQQAKNLQPDSTEIDVMWANVLYTQGKLSGEKKTYYATLNKELGDQRRQISDWRGAIAYYEQAILMQPNLAEAHYYLGLTLQTQGDAPDNTIKAHYRRAWQLQPDYREAEVSLATVQYRQGQLSIAEQDLYATANYQLGNKYQKIDDIDVAITYYRQAILMQPNLAVAYYHLGQVLQFKGQSYWNEAISCYQAAQKLNPDYQEASIGIATVLYQQCQLDQTDQLKYADMAYNLGNSQKQAGDLETAIDFYQLALAMNPSLADARKALQIALQEHDGVTIKVNCTKQS